MRAFEWFQLGAVIFFAVTYAIIYAKGRKAAEWRGYDQGYEAAKQLFISDAKEFYRDHQRYEYLRLLNVPEFQALFKRALGEERFDDIVDACLAGCTPGCRDDGHPGCAYCMEVPGA